MTRRAPALPFGTRKETPSRQSVRVAPADVGRVLAMLAGRGVWAVRIAEIGTGAALLRRMDDKRDARRRVSCDGRDQSHACRRCSTAATTAVSTDTSGYLFPVTTVG